MNKRTEKYKLDILDSLYVLVDEIGYESINVSKLCKQANISRQGFYIHYKNIDDVIVDQVRQVWVGIKGRFDQHLSIEHVISYLYTYYYELYIEKPSLFDANIIKIVKKNHSIHMKEFIQQCINVKTQDLTTKRFYQIDIETQIILNMFELLIEREFDLTVREFIGVVKKYINWELIWK